VKITNRTDSAIPGNTARSRRTKSSLNSQKIAAANATTLSQREPEKFGAAAKISAPADEQDADGQENIVEAVQEAEALFVGKHRFAVAPGRKGRRRLQGSKLLGLRRIDDAGIDGRLQIFGCQHGGHRISPGLSAVCCA
jgi:hypothetical protein